MSADTHDAHTRRILDKVASTKSLSQRNLARELGIALGLTNLLMRRLIAKGWIRVVRIRPNRVRYLLTPAGLAQRARYSRDYLMRSVRFYAEARERIRESFIALSAEWNCDTNGPEKRVVFFGGGEVAEIAYVCMQETDLKLVGVVDENRTRPFFGLPVGEPQELTASHLLKIPYERVIVMSLDHDERIRRRLVQAGIPPERVFWI